MSAPKYLATVRIRRGGLHPCTSVVDTARVRTKRRNRDETEGEQRARLAVRAQIVRWGWTPGVLARMAGVSKSTVERMLDGQIWPQPSTLGKIAMALEWNPPDILQRIADGDESPPPLEALPPEKRWEIERVAQLPPDVSMSEMLQLLDYLEFIRKPPRHRS